MPYIGNTSPSRFVSNRAASVYSGDGSTTAFTLEQAVAQDEDVLVSVDGVIQEPSVAYAVSNGTTLTFTGAPSSDSGNNIFVYYLASQVGTVGHPSNQALSASTGTFTGDVTLTGTTPTLTIGDAGAEDTKIVFDGNAQDFYIGLDDSADDLVIGKGSAVGTTPALSIDENMNATFADGTSDVDIASHDGSNGLKLGGTLVTSTAAELNIVDGGTAASSVTLVDADRVVINDGGTMKQIAMTTLDADRFSIVTTAPTDGTGKRTGHVWYVV